MKTGFDCYPIPLLKYVLLAVWQMSKQPFTMFVKLVHMVIEASTEHGCKAVGTAAAHPACEKTYCNFPLLNVMVPRVSRCKSCRKLPQQAAVAAAGNAMVNPVQQWMKTGCRQSTSIIQLVFMLNRRLSWQQVALMSRIE